MTSPPPRSGAPAARLDPAAGQVAVARALRAADELSALSPDLGWAEATGLADALVEALAHRCTDVAAGREEPGPLPLVLGAIGGPDGLVDHASCRAAAARLRASRSVLGGSELVWAQSGAEVAGSFADLLDQLADRARSRPLTRADKAVVLRRLHGLHRQLR